MAKNSITLFATSSGKCQIRTRRGHPPHTLDCGTRGLWNPRFRIPPGWCYRWTMTNDPVELPYDEKIADLERQLEAARQSTLALEGQLEWWKRGRELYGHAATNGNATELVPEEHVFQTGTKPTLAPGHV